MRSPRAAPQTPSARTVMDMAMAFQASRILLTACELDLFTILAGKRLSAAQAARAMKTNTRATDRLLRALTAIGLLQVQRNRFSNTPVAELCLVRGKREFLGGLLHAVHLWDSWSTLTRAVRKGTSVAPGPMHARSRDWTKPFIAAMHWRAARQAPAVLDLLDLRGVSRVLDVGAGSGAYAMAFARAGQDTRVVAFDLPKVLRLTRSYVADAGLLKKVSFVAGDYNRDAFGRGFDVVFLSAIVHINSPAENVDLVRRCAAALNPGGQLVVQDFVMDKPRTQPAFGALFALNMLVNTEAGDTYTEAEIRGWMKRAGLARIVRRNLDAAAATSLIVGRKPNR